MRKTKYVKGSRCEGNAFQSFNRFLHNKKAKISVSMISIIMFSCVTASSDAYNYVEGNSNGYVSLKLKNNEVPIYNGSGFEDSYNNEGILNGVNNSLAKNQNSVVEDTNFEYEKSKEQVAEATGTYANNVSYSDEERIMMQYIVEMEAHGLSKEHKTLIACVIVNRCNSEKFQENTIESVLTAEGQFSSLFNYYQRKFEPDDDTVQAVDDVLSGKINAYDYAEGSIFFYNPDRSGGYINDFERREFLYEMDGHRFFR